MRELTLKEVENVSGAGFFQSIFPAHTAMFSRNPIGGSPYSQIRYANTVNLFRNTAFSTATFFGGRGIDFGINFAIQKTPMFIFPDPYNY